MNVKKWETEALSFMQNNSFVNSNYSKNCQHINRKKKIYIHRKKQRKET